jgi:PAS domain S-box-containing protein
MASPLDGIRAEDRDARRPRVLWATDPVYLREYGRALRQRFEVHAVPDGVEVLASARLHSFALVISDVASARRNRFAWLRALRADPALCAIPVILLGTRVGEKLRNEAIEAGADDVVVEPFSARELVARVETQIELARMRREATAAVRESEKRTETARALLGAIVESSDDAIISKDLDGIITSWNPSAERIFGYTAAEAIGRSVTMLIPPDRRDEEPRILERLKRGERVDHFETVRVRKDGTLLDISVTISPVKDSDGRVVGASKVAREVGERKRAEAELNQQRLIAHALYETEQRLRQEAEAAGRAKDEFLAMLGHELRNPLAAISNAVIASDVEASYTPQALAIIRRGAEQLTRLVDDLLDVARITHGKIALHRQRVRLVEVVERAVEITRARVEERSQRLTLSLPREPLDVEADEFRLEQALVNLVSNAAKYTGDGGNIAIAVERDGESAVVRVKDDGIGIAPDLLPRIFELFAQGQSDLARTAGGLGIGLTIVRRIVELHGGQVEAHSPGRGMGSEFVIRLPALRQREPLAPSARSESAAATRSLRVLLVEDNRDAADSMAFLLERLGHHVQVARDGASALELARATDPELVLVDIGLPGMDGYEVARRLRSGAGRAAPRLVALTGYGGPEHRERALAAGFDQHLTKPIELSALRALTRGAAR